MKCIFCKEYIINGGLISFKCDKCDVTYSFRLNNYEYKYDCLLGSGIWLHVFEDFISIFTYEQYYFDRVHLADLNIDKLTTKQKLIDRINNLILYK